MKLLDVPARRGFAWVRGAFEVLLKQPLGFAGLFTTCFFLLMLIGLVPVIGMMMFAAMPVVSLLFMIATRRALAGDQVIPGTFLALTGAGRPRLFALAKLGLVCGAAMLAVFWIGNLVDGGAFLELQQHTDSPEEMTKYLGEPALQAGLLVRVVLLALISIPAWHAPALVFWGGQSWGRALFFSSYACWRNKGAFVVFAFGWISVWVLMAALINLLVSLLQSGVMVAIVVPLTLAFWTAVGASVYLTFADCFDPETGDTPLPVA